MLTEKPLNIGALAKATDTKVETIRWYERVGLLPAPARTTGNYRIYDDAHLGRLSFIRRARDLGFSLDQIRALLDLAGAAERTRDGRGAGREQDEDPEADRAAQPQRLAADPRGLVLEARAVQPGDVRGGPVDEEVADGEQ